MTTQKKLYKSRSDKMIEGVCGGLGEYFNVDPTLIRLGFALSVVGGFGAGVLIYIVLAIVVPEAPETPEAYHEIETPVQDEFDFEVREREIYKN
jgi:phage shock protein C